MSEKSKNERPEVYALRQDGGNWQISRRDFLKAAGIGAAAVGLGLPSRFVRPVSAAENLEELCREAPAHKSRITDLQVSADGRYLISIDEDAVMKCWDMETYVLLKTAEAPEGVKAFEGVVSIDGTSVAVWKASERSLGGITFPDLEEYEDRINISFSNYNTLKNLAFSRDGDIYAVSDKFIFRLEKGDEEPFYENQTMLYASLGKAKDLAVFAGNMLLFVLNEKGFGVLDLETGKMHDIETSGVYEAFSAIPEGSNALVCEKNGNGYKLLALDSGDTVWSNRAEQGITAAAISPEEDCAVLLEKDEKVRLISMANGDVINQFGTGEVPLPRIAVSADGSLCAVAVDKSILFFSLPDLKILGCPVDLNEMKDDTKGIEVTGTDPVSGKTITYTLPCGAPIPAGAVCTCNCVAGTVCSCVGYNPCTCVGHISCTCVGHISCSCVGHVVTTHYWHPN